MLNTLASRASFDSDALHLAAQSVIETRVVEGTIAEVASSSALDHAWSALFRYALLRVGARRAAALLLQLAEDQPRAGSSTDERPCPELYRALRRACLLRPSADRGGAQAELEQTGQFPLQAGGDWFWTAPDLEYARRLAALRRGLAGERAEVVELHLVHGLDLSGVAHVMELTEQRAAACLNEALQAARSGYPAPPRRRRAPVLRRGAVVAERYEIRRLLGAGAFADVYEARDQEVEGHSVALKMSRTVCRDEWSAQLALRELQLLASVFHPSVVQLKDHGWHESHLWFVMPLYRGQTLSARLRRGPLSRAEAEAFFVPLAEALATMHRAGVLHQDIKPDNIFLAEIDPAESGAGQPGADLRSARILPVLLDLGVAARTAEVVLAGTPAYLAPEVAARFTGLPDPAPVGPKADVFALALTLRDALKPDLEMGPPCTSVDAFVAHRATHAPEVPANRPLRDLRAAFGRWLALRPDDRPTADGLRRELALLTAPQRRAARRAAALRWAVPTTVAALALFCSVVFWLSREAALQRAGAADARLAADRARERAAALQTDVRFQQERSRKLEADVSRLQTDYDRSQLTRTEIAQRLELAENALHETADRFGAQRRRVAGLTQATDALQQERDELQHSLRRSQAKLAAERKEAAQQQQYRAGLEQRIADLESALEDARSRAQPASTAGSTAKTPRRQGNR